MKKSLLISVAAMCLLASCGSDDDGNPTPTPSPSPTSSPIPTPSPTPTPATYTAFADLTGDRTFDTSCSGLTLAAPPTALETSEFGEGNAIAYNASAQTYTITAQDRSLTVGPSNLDSSAPEGVISYVVPSDNGPGDRFALVAPLAGEERLAYVRFASIVSTSVQPALVGLCALGVPTQVTDVPDVASVSFTRSAVFGTGYAGNVSYNLASSTARLTVDLADDGEITGTLILTGVPVQGGAAVTLGTFNFVGEIDGEENKIYGAITDSNSYVVGHFGGAFFGPQGAEFGVAYDITNGSQLIAAGTAFGGR